MLRRVRKSRNLGNPGCDRTTTAVDPRTQRRRKSRGQSLAEFAILLPVLTLVLALSADFGRAFTAYIAISSSAREGAAYAMASSTQAADNTAVRNAALADAPTIWGKAPVVSNPVVTTDAQGYPSVSVTVTYTFDTIMPIPPIPNSITLDRTVSMRIIN